MIWNKHEQTRENQEGCALGDGGTGGRRRHAAGRAAAADVAAAAGAQHHQRGGAPLLRLGSQRQPRAVHPEPTERLGRLAPVGRG